MGLLDSAKGMVDKAMNAVGKNKDQVKSGIDKAAEFAKDKVGDEHADKIDKGVDAAKDFVEGLDDDDQ